MTVYAKGKLFIIWAIIFLGIVVVLALLGFTGVEAHDVWIFNTLAIVFLILFAILLLTGRKTPAA